MTRLLLSFAVVLTGLATLATPVLAREEIRSFTSNITLRTDGSVDVVETLEVNVERNQINHGIYRDLPLWLINEDKSRLRSSLAVLQVLKDGVQEPFSIEDIGSGFKRIRIGDGDVWLDSRVYKYTNHYTNRLMAP
jgi:hypothetical protein